MAYTIVKNYMPESKYSLKSPYSMKPIGITVHNTANSASAINEVKYMLGNSSSTSYHVAVDDVNVVLAIPFNRNAWHAGDGNGNGNRKTIGIEICYSKSGGAKFDASEKNAAKYIAKLLKEYNWTIKNVYTHQSWSGKNCPHRTLEYGWKRFLDMVQDELDKLNKPAKNKNFPAVPFTVQVLVDKLNYRSTGSMSGKVLGQIGKGKYTITEVKNGWGKLKSKTGWICIENASYCKIGSTVKTFKSYLVKVAADSLNIRSGAGTNYEIKGAVKKDEIFTIVAEKTNGSTKWGKLKSGEGWISLGYVDKV